MVWFQCEDCGENLKKPKLGNHFRMCSANKLSCIDCGVTFGQQSVQSHTQCITEAEKYGPKGQGKASNNTPAKANADTKKKPAVDINVGLSSRPPWFCSLCNTNATSKQTLLLHAEGKKHGAKARAFHASQQQSKETSELTSSTKDLADLAGDLPKGDSVCNKGEEEPSKQDLSNSTSTHTEVQNGTLLSEKKRKLVDSDYESDTKKKDSKDSADLSNGEVIQTKKGKTGTNLAGNEKEAKKKIKWEKLITSVLRSNPDGAMKLRKLQKLVLKSVQECGQTEEEDQLKEKLVEKINSSTRFTLDNKLVRLVAKD